MYSAEEEFLNFQKKENYFLRFRFGKKARLRPSRRVYGPYKLIQAYLKHRIEFKSFKDDMDELIDYKDPSDARLSELLRHI